MLRITRLQKYANCAAAMRKVTYHKLPGFPEFFRHMYEEPDYALQCYGAGWAVWFEPSIIIRHHLSISGRNTFKTHHLNARNELWSVWLRCPWPYLPFVSLYRITRQFLYACTEGMSWVFNEPCWWLDAFFGLNKCIKKRNPIPWKKNPLYTLSEFNQIIDNH